MWTIITVSVFSFYKAEEVLWATAATALVTLSLTLFALQTKVSVIETDFCHKGECRQSPLPLLTQSPPSSFLFSAVLWDSPAWPPHLPAFLVTTFKKQKVTGGIIFNNIFYLTQYMQSIIISTNSQYNKNVNEIVYVFFFQNKFQIRCVFYIASTSQFGLAMFQGLSSHVYWKRSWGQTFSRTRITWNAH